MLEKTESTKSGDSVCLVSYFRWTVPEQRSVLWKWKLPRTTPGGTRSSRWWTSAARPGWCPPAGRPWCSTSGQPGRLWARWANLEVGPVWCIIPSPGGTCRQAGQPAGQELATEVLENYSLLNYVLLNIIYNNRFICLVLGDVKLWVNFDLWETLTMG